MAVHLKTHHGQEGLAISPEHLLTAHRLAHEVDSQAAVVVKFPDMDSLDNWYNSEAYQAVIPLRDDAATLTIVKYEAMG